MDVDPRSFSVSNQRGFPAEGPARAVEEREERGGRGLPSSPHILEKKRFEPWLWPCSSISQPKGKTNQTAFLAHAKHSMQFTAWRVCRTGASVR